MQQASKSEIQKRLTAQLVRGELFSSFFAASIPIFNAFFFWHTGKKVATVASDYNKARRIYSIFGWILLLLPFVIAQIFMTLSEYPQIYFRFYSVAIPIFWILYLVPVYLIARKHTSILKNLGMLEAKI